MTSHTEEPAYRVPTYPPPSEAEHVEELVRRIAEAAACPCGRRRVRHCACTEMYDDLDQLGRAGADLPCTFWCAGLSLHVSVLGWLCEHHPWAAWDLLKSSSVDLSGAWGVRLGAVAQGVAPCSLQHRLRQRLLDLGLDVRRGGDGRGFSSPSMWALLLQSPERHELPRLLGELLEKDESLLDAPIKDWSVLRAEDVAAPWALTLVQEARGRRAAAGSAGAAASPEGGAGAAP